MNEELEQGEKKLEKLHYQKFEGNRNIEYENFDDGSIILLDKTHKTFEKFYVGYEDCLVVSITMEELKAINLICQGLEWISKGELK